MSNSNQPPPDSNKRKLSLDLGWVEQVAAENELNDNANLVGSQSWGKDKQLLAEAHMRDLNNPSARNSLDPNPDRTRQDSSPISASNSRRRRTPATQTPPPIATTTNNNAEEEEDFEDYGEDDGEQHSKIARMKERKRKIEKQRRVGVNEQFDVLTSLLDEISPLYAGGGSKKKAAKKSSMNRIEIIARTIRIVKSLKDLCGDDVSCRCCSLDTQPVDH